MLPHANVSKPDIHSAGMVKRFKKKVKKEWCAATQLWGYHASGFSRHTLFSHPDISCR